MVEQSRDEYVRVNRQLRNRVVAQTVSGQQKTLASAASCPSYREPHSSDTTDSEEETRPNSHRPRHPVAAQKDARDKAASSHTVNTTTDVAQRNEHNSTSASEQENRDPPSKAGGASQKSNVFKAKLEKFKLKTNLTPVVQASKNRSLLSPLQGAFPFSASTSETEPATGARVEAGATGAQADSPKTDVTQRPKDTSASMARDGEEEESSKAVTEEEQNREPTTPIK